MLTSLSSLPWIYFLHFCFFSCRAGLLKTLSLTPCCPIEWLRLNSLSNCRRSYWRVMTCSPLLAFRVASVLLLWTDSLKPGVYAFHFPFIFESLSPTKNTAGTRKWLGYSLAAIKKYYQYWQQLRSFAVSYLQQWPSRPPLYWFVSLIFLSLPFFIRFSQSSFLPPRPSPPQVFIWEI